MELKKVNYEPKENIDDFLNNTFNVELYAYLLDHDKGIDLVPYFNALYREYDIILNNRNKASQIVDHLLSLDLEKEFLLNLIIDLSELIKHNLKENNITDDYLEALALLLSHQWERLDTADLPEYPSNSSASDFELTAEIEGLKPPKQINGKRTTLKQIALYFIYQGWPITVQNCDEIASVYDLAGSGLLNRYNHYWQACNRRGSEKTEQRNKNKIKLIESIIPYLPEDKQVMANDEVKLIKTYIDEN